MTEIETTSNKHYGRILAIYCVGLLIGGLYVGMVAPVRTVVQAQFSLNDSVGIWMINIYTLFYAALIPVIGKIADKHGRNLVFGFCVLIFMAGATMCGLSSHVDAMLGLTSQSAVMSGASSHAG